MMLIKKEKIIAIIIILLFSISTLGVNVLSEKTSNFEEIKSFITISKPQIIETKNGYQKIELAEANSYLLEPGKPILPTITKVFTFPLGTNIIDVNAIIQSSSYKLEKQIMPFLKSMILTSSKLNDITPGFFKDESIYKLNGLHPETSFLVNKAAGIQDNEHVLYVIVKIIPQYNPMENKIYIPEKVEIEIDYTQPEKTLLNHDEYDMVIITPEVFSDNLQQLVNHKNNVGIQSFLRTTEQIFNEYQGRDPAEQIKYFIKDSIEKLGISYVLLIGSPYKLPMRQTHITIPEWGSEWGIQSDLYYSDIYNSDMSFSDWDTNKNDRFGEFYWTDISEQTGNYTDFVDLYPDIKVGRIPCENKYELKIALNKIIKYETSQDENDWFNRIILMGGDTFPPIFAGTPGVYEGEIVTQKVFEMMPEFKPVKLWASLDSFNPESINREIAKGAGFVSFSGNANIHSISTYLPDETDTNDEIVYSMFNLFGLRNLNKLPVVFLEGTITGLLSHRSIGKIFPCLGSLFLIKPSGGSIATIAPSSTIYYIMVDDEIISGAPILQINFFKAYTKGISISDMFTKSQTEYLNYHWKDCFTLDAFLLLGDPSLKIGGYQTG